MLDKSLQQENRAHDYARSAVPNAVHVSGVEIALVIIGGTIGFAIFIVAAQIGGSLGYAGAAVAFGVGSFILGVMGAATSYVGARTRLSTYLLTQYAFGQRGARLSNIAVAISLIGWYGVISNFLGQAGQQMLLDAFSLTVPTWIPVLAASLLMIGVTLAGFSGIDKLALWLVPLMLLFILYAAFKSRTLAAPQAMTLTDSFSMHTAISAVVGSYIAGVIIQPDYSRFAKHPISAALAVFFALGISFPLIQFLSAMPSLSLGNPDILAVMNILGLALPAFLLLVLGAWSSNVLCLYSAGLSLATVIPALSLQKIIIAIGIIGTSLAFVQAQSYLINFLVVLGVVIPPIGAIYCLDALLVSKFEYGNAQPTAGYLWFPLLSWAAGVAMGFAAHLTVLSITGISSLDSFLTSAVCYLLVIKLLMNKKRR